MARRRHAKLLNNLLEVRLQNDEGRSEFELTYASRGENNSYSYEKSVSFLTQRGLLEEDVRLGSIPEVHLDGMCRFLKSQLSSNRINGLQVGTFIGISLASLCDFLSKSYEDGVIISIDPNLQHRGIPKPLDHALALLDHFGFSDKVLILNGYSMNKSLSNDGINYFESYDPKQQFAREYAPINQLSHLVNLASEKMDFILLDGNHNAKYLEKEISMAKKLIQPNGFIILDDVNQSWSTIQNVFNTSESVDLKKVYFDGRIGILAKMGNPAEAITLPSE